MTEIIFSAVFVFCKIYILLSLLNMNIELVGWWVSGRWSLGWWSVVERFGKNAQYFCSCGIYLIVLMFLLIYGRFTNDLKSCVIHIWLKVKKILVNKIEQNNHDPIFLDFVRFFEFHFPRYLSNRFAIFITCI